MKLLPALLAAVPSASSQKPPKECVFTNWSNWSECSWLCGPNGTKERTRQIRLPKNGQHCLSNGLEPVLKEVEACNRNCMNGGKMTNTRCVCKSAYTGECCETPKSASVDRCDKRIRKPEGGTMKCGRSRVPAVEGSLPWNWSCSPRCPKGKGMYRAHGDVYQCNSQGWIQQTLTQRSFDFDDYDDDTPTLPLADCADRHLIVGTGDSMKLVYRTNNENGTLTQEELDMALEEEGFGDTMVPESLKSVINSECGAKGTSLNLSVDYNVVGGNGLRAKVRRQRIQRETDIVYEDETNYDEFGDPELLQNYTMYHDIGMDDYEEAEDVPYTVTLSLKYKIKQMKHATWETQEMARQKLRDCVGSVMSSFEAEMADESGEFPIATAMRPPVDMDEPIWPYWDRAGAGCPAGSVLVGGSVQEPLECQACPKGTVYLSKQKGLREICRPCPSGTWMDREGAVANDAGEVGMCNACPSPAHMTNTFPAYSKNTCVKTSCFPNRTKFQVVFALDSSGSVTRPDYIRMREFAKSIVDRMCINNSHEGGSKSCGQAAYVIYNQSPESYMKFKQVESQVDFNKIDNYEYRGGPPRIGDLFEFIHDTYIDTTQLKNGLPLNVVLISDGQTQNDDKEQMEKWTRILKKKVTKIITLSKRSIYNGNTLQLASSIDDRYFMNDYHELPGFVYPVMEKLCNSVASHKGQLQRAKKLRIERRKAGRT